MGKNRTNRITYIQPGDVEAWIDWPMPRNNSPAFLIDRSEQCSVCCGHGGWNLLLSAYPVPYESTAENRHLFSHMKATCNVCAGHGWVRIEDKRCVHEFRYLGMNGKSTQFSCVHCNQAVVWNTRRA